MTDLNLLHSYAANRDAEAFAQIVERYEGLIFAACRRRLIDPEDVEDAVQETFLQLARKADVLNANLGGFAQRYNVPA